MTKTGMTCGSQLSPPKQGDLEGLHILPCYTFQREKDSNPWSRQKADARKAVQILVQIL